MKKVLLIAILATMTAPVFAERFINFTDANGKRHQYELAGDDEIVVTRPNGIGEAVIVYEDGELFSSTTHRSDGSDEVSIKYQNGELFGAGIQRPDGSVEVLIAYEDGALTGATTQRLDGSIEAWIVYKNGELVGVCKGDECL